MNTYKNTNSSYYSSLLIGVHPWGGGGGDYSPLLAQDRVNTRYCASGHRGLTSGVVAQTLLEYRIDTRAIGFVFVGMIYWRLLQEHRNGSTNSKKKHGIRVQKHSKYRGKIQAKVKVKQGKILRMFY